MKPFIYNLDFVKKQSEKNLFSVVSMFAGGGGSSTGYKLAGGNILAVNEFIPLAQQTYLANYPNTIMFEDDIRLLSGEKILNKLNIKQGELDILDGSPPCASFSIAGAKEKMWGQIKKYSDTEQRTDDLFFEFCRILNEIKPKVFVCENVKGLTIGTSKALLGSEQYDLFNTQENTILHSLIKCGYVVKYKVLNAKNYKVPQSRERTIIIGVRQDIKKQITFPKGENELVTIGECFPNIESIQMKRNAFGENEPRKVQKNDVCFTVTTDGIGANRRYVVNRKYNDVEQKNEKLTIDELKTICSFPSDYKLTGSYSRQWERLGRSVPPLMMKSIADHIYQTLL